MCSRQSVVRTTIMCNNASMLPTVIEPIINASIDNIIGWGIMIPLLVIWIIFFLVGFVSTPFFFFYYAKLKRITNKKYPGMLTMSVVPISKEEIQDNFQAVFNSKKYPFMSLLSGNFVSDFVSLNKADKLRDPEIMSAVKKVRHTLKLRNYMMSICIYGLFLMIAILLIWTITGGILQT